MAERYQPFDPRQYMSRPDFEVFHSQDPQAPDIDLHHHDFYEVYVFLSGQVEYRVEGHIYNLEPGDVLLISPMELHQLLVKESQSVYERFVLWIDREYLERFSTAEASLTRCFDHSLDSHTNLLRPNPVQRADILSRMDALVRESYSSDYASSMAAAGILVQLMVLINRMVLDSNKQTAHDGATPLISGVLGYINQHYNEAISLDELALRFYVSKYHLSHEFRKVVGTGVYRYITLKRLLIAKQMLSSGISPGVAYSHCGFNDYANFYRAFKARYGISPKECLTGSV